MGRWSREELEDAFAEYQRVALVAGTTGDWDAWADGFTEAATYIEHPYGTPGGRGHQGSCKEGWGRAPAGVLRSQLSNMHTLSTLPCCCSNMVVHLPTCKET